jgi:uncharacterized protein with PhoU and TrkA domain
MAFWEQIKGKTQAVQIKMRMLLLENSIDGIFLRLGSRAYDLRKEDLPFADDGEAKSLMQEISSKKQELAQWKKEFQKKWREEAKELKSNLERGDGALEQVEVSFLSAAAGKKIRDIHFPKEVLLGPILRGEELIIPDGETEILAADRVTLMGKKKDVEGTAKLLKGIP